VAEASSCCAVVEHNIGAHVDAIAAIAARAGKPYEWDMHGLQVVVVALGECLELL
jgi:hypothetical protein